MEAFFGDPYELGMQELRHDLLFHKIPPEQYGEFIDCAWQAGRDAAETYSRRLGSDMPSEMASKLGLTVEEMGKDQCKGYRAYSEYYSNPKKIILYMPMIEEAYQHLSEEQKAFIPDFSKMKELFLAHEIFHHLECHEIGLTSRKKKVETLHLGPVRLTSGIKALSEIGAHSFTRNLLGIRAEAVWPQ